MAIRVGEVLARRKHGKAKAGGRLSCSFCGKSQHELQKLIAGPAVFICDECVKLCSDILDSKANRDVTEAWEPWQALSDTHLLATLPGVLTHSESVRDGLQSRVDELRKREVSWTRIGEALGMSRQAAWERFA